MGVKVLLHPYYIVNILMSVSFWAAKLIPQVCWVVFEGEDQCELGGRQIEILFYLLMVVPFRARKTGSMSMVAYLNNSFIYGKLANLVLWFLSHNIYGLIFLSVFFVQVLLLPQPTYSGPQHILYFRDAKTFKEVISKEKKTVWMIEFYTAFNTACVNFAPIFGELSAKYGLDNFKFGKVDLARFPEVGEEFLISTSTSSTQLPTIILFRDGKPAMVRPNWGSNRKLLKFHMNLENIVTSFGLNDLHKELNEELKKRKKTPKKSAIHAKSEQELRNQGGRGGSRPLIINNK